MPTPTFQKYVFNGGATAFHGNIRKPYFQDLGKHLEISTYAGAAVNIRCTNVRFAFGADVSYDSAMTSITTSETGDFFESEVVAQVKGLSVFGRLFIGEVTSRLRSVYDRRWYPQRVVARVSPGGSTLQNLTIDGRQLELKLPAAFGVSDPEANEFLYGPPEYISNPTPDVKLIPAPFAIENFGTIYYAEWAAEAQDEGGQHLTMVRLALGSDQGGDADVGCTYSDGSGWPPRS